MSLRIDNVVFKLPFRRGIYETEYGNAAYVSGPKAKTAWDIDGGQRIPIESVTHKFLRPVSKGETFGDRGSW
jgi:hypothetical protein